MLNIAPERLPKHVAVIMDGNGRWAERRGHPRAYGHIRGAQRIRELVRESGKLGIRALTLYAFSTENWSRSDSEKQVLWKLFVRYLKKETHELQKQNVRLNIIGEFERLGENVKAVARDSMKALASNTGLQLNLAISYGSRQEIIEACRSIAKACVEKRLDPSQINENLFTENLMTGFMGPLSDVDLVIRTSGEKRVSNFLLYQSAYAEYVFLEICFPDFDLKAYWQALEEFGTRQRRFGGLEVKK